MLHETSCTRDSASVLQERELLEQVISLGVGYPYGNKLGISKAAISNADVLHRCISRALNFQKYSDAGNTIQEVQDHIRSGDGGYYLLDLHNGGILAKEQYPIEDIIIDFSSWDTDDRILLRGRKGTCLHDTRFLIVPDKVLFWGMNGILAPLKEFHMLSFICVDGDSKAGFVVDYDATQNVRPLVLFLCEENSDIIQDQLDYDDRCGTEDYESIIGNIGFAQKNR